MINYRLVYRILGQLLFIESGFLLLCLAVSLGYGEDDSFAFLASTLITSIAGMVARFFGRGSDNTLSRRDAYLVATMAWVVCSVFGMLPYMIGGYIPNVSNAYFETMSGFTTTGASILNDVENFPHGILFWRSLTQWIGGLGIVFFTIAVLPSIVGGSMKVFAAEATGPIKSKLHPRLSTSAKWIWSIYLVLTMACLAYFWAAGTGLFDAVNYSMTTTATGGFAPHNDSLLHFHSPMVEYIGITFQFLSGINFMMLYMSIFKGKLPDLMRNSEFRLYVSVVTIATAWIMFLLITTRGYELEQAFRSSLFQVVSFITTTGLFNDDAGQWPHITWVILGCCMFIGACAGSTSGGFKCIRGVMILKVIRNEFRHVLHPNAVLPIKINGQTVPQSKLPSLLAFLAVFVLMTLVSATIMISIGVDNTNAITIALSCVSNVGPTLGTEIGPVMSWDSLPEAVKWISSMLMLMGRLEIMTVLMLFSPAFWKEN